MKLNPELSKLAKKFLDVPASEADVEWMFNISGLIFNNYENLVFLKLNQKVLSTSKQM